MNVPGNGNAQTISILINLQASQQAAQQSAQVLNQAAAALDKTTKSALSLKQAGRDLRETGGFIAAAGVGILAPFVAAANQYEQKYARLEPIANAYAIAQKKQADASIQLGRVGAQALTPFLNQVADVEKKIADFAQAHPDIVQAVVGGGAVLATVGASMAAVGQVLVTVANAAKLLGVQANGIKTLFGNMATAAGGLALGFAALQVAVPLTISGINAIGRAFNDPRLAHLTLADVLDTGAQAIKIALVSIVTALVNAGEAVTNAIEDVKHIGDPSWQGKPITAAGAFSGIVSNMTSTLTGLAKTKIDPDLAVKMAFNSVKASIKPDADKILGGGNASVGQLIKDFLPGSSGLASLSVDQINKILDGISTPQQLALFVNDAQSLLDIDPTLKQLMGPGQSPQEKFQAQTKAAGDAAINQATALIGGNAPTGGGGGGGGSTGTGTDTTAETANAYIAMQKANAQADIQLAQQKLAAQTSYNQESLKLEKDREAQISVLLADQNRARLRAIADFNESEKMTEQKLQFERQQQLYTMGLQANELAIQGDVAGFISAQIQNRNTILEQDRQNAFDKKQRQEQFDFQQAQQAQADKVALDQQKAQFAREDADRKTAYDDQLKALQVSNENTKNENLRAFTEQIAQITGSNSAVALIYQNWYLQQEKAAQDFVDKQTATLAKLYGQTLGITVPNVNAPPPPNQQGAPVQTFASGTNFVPRDMYAYIHRGEMIIPASQAANMRSGGHRSMNVTIAPSITIGAGNNVSRSEVQDMFQDVANRIVSHLDNQMALNYGATQ